MGMVHVHFGIAVHFSGGYNEYFELLVDVDTCVYMNVCEQLN